MANPAFLALVRKACPPALWSQGVKLAREGAITLEAESSSEVRLRVRERGRAVSPTVQLYPEDEEWTCDCESKAAVCAHAAGATIAWEQGLELGAVPALDAEGESTPGASKEPLSALVYALRFEHGLLRVERFVETPDGTRARLALSLADRIARGVASPRLEPTHDDVQIDRIFYKKLHGDVPIEHLRTVLDALSRAPKVELDGKPIKTSGDLCYPEVRASDGPGSGVRLTIVAPASLTVLALGVGLFDGQLRPLAETGRFGHRFDKLPIDRVFAPAELGSLAAEVLPELERTMVVTITTRRIPRREKRMIPRIEFELSHELGALHVLPLVVYGDPPIARIDAGRLVLLARGTPAPVRDEAKEREITSRLLDQLSLVPGRRVRYDGRAAVDIASKLERFSARDPGAKTIGEGARRRELTPRIVTEGDQIEVVFEATLDDGEGRTPVIRVAKAADVARAFAEGLGIVALEGGGFAHLPEGFVQKHGQTLLDLVASQEDDGSVPKTAFPVLHQIAKELGVDLPGVNAIVEPLLAGFEGVPVAPLPQHFRGELRPYQQKGVDWLVFLRESGLGGLLADDMGLGKTVQICAALRGPALVVCPRSVVHNWKSELARFRPDLRVAVYEGASRALSPEADVTLVTYALLRNDVEELTKPTFAMVVLDEAQAIKNPDSQSARAAFRLRAGARFALTGTPVENRLEDLWSLMRFSNPGLLGPRADFDERFARPIAEGTGEVAARLRKRVRPFLLRRTKKQVLTDLPPRTESVLYAELGDEERGVYSAVLAATKREVMERLGAGESVLMVLEALLRLRQAACHPGLLPNRSDTTSSKVERLTDTLSELAADGHKALVFSQWTGLLDRIEPHLGEAGLGFVRLDGSTRDREGVVRAFQAEGGPPVMLLSLKAGGVGLNLTAADHVFLCDPWWNPAVEEQAADRAHRIGQDRPVNVYRMVAKDTVEERILALQEKKRALAGALEGGGGSGGTITRDDLLGLLDDA